MAWPVLSEATFDVRELGSCRGSRGKEEKGLKGKRMLYETVHSAASGFLLCHVSETCPLLVCLPGSPVQPGELTVLFRDSQGQRWKNRKSRDYLVSLNPAAWVDRAGRSPQSRQDKKVRSTGLEEPGPISRAWC